MHRKTISRPFRENNFEKYSSILNDASIEAYHKNTKSLLDGGHDSSPSRNSNILKNTKGKVEVLKNMDKYKQVEVRGNHSNSLSPSHISK